MDIAEALRSLQVRDDTLALDEKKFLDEYGYLIIKNVMSAEKVQAFGHRLDECAAEEGDDAGKEFAQESAAVRLSNLVDKDPIFEQCLTTPRHLAAIRHVLGDNFKLSSLNSRATRPGHGRQGLHADWDCAVKRSDHYVCNSAWLISDFTSVNGATRLVPRSHRSGKLPTDIMEDETADHPDQIQLIAPAGSVVVFNAHTWHGGMANHTDSLRKVIHAYFCRRDQPQQTDQRKWLRKQTIARLSRAVRVLLDVDDVGQ